MGQKWFRWQNISPNMSVTQNRVLTCHIHVQIKLRYRPARRTVSFHFQHKVPQLLGQVLWVVMLFVITFFAQQYDALLWGHYVKPWYLLSVLRCRMLRSRSSTPTCNSLPFKACREWGPAPPPDLPFFPGHVLTLLRFIFARVSQSPAQTYWTLSWEPSRPCCVCLLLDRQIRLSLISLTARPWKWV